MNARRDDMDNWIKVSLAICEFVESNWYGQEKTDALVYHNGELVTSLVEGAPDEFWINQNDFRIHAFQTIHYAF